MSRGWKIALGVAAGVIAVNVLLAGLRSLTGGHPGGPRSSSYATGDDGLAAYAELVAQTGHRVERLRERPSGARLDPAVTLVVLDPHFVAHDDAAALAAFLDHGGRLVAGGQTSGSWLRSVLDSGPRWSSARIRDGRVLAPVAELDGIESLRTGGGSWSRTGGALPAFGGDDGAVLAVAQRGAGRALLLADAAPLQNANLDHGDDAALGVALAGPRGRPVVFAESFHGYGRASGLGAIPDRWWAFLALGLVAAATLILARGRRLGPAESESRELPPPRLAYVESLGGVLARTRAREAAAEAIRAEAARVLERRAGLPRGADRRELVRAATGLGVRLEDAEALIAPTEHDADVLAAGRALAKLRRDHD